MLLANYHYEAYEIVWRHVCNKEYRKCSNIYQIGNVTAQAIIEETEWGKKEQRWKGVATLVNS